jgi:hypothetical protein
MVPPLWKTEVRRLSRAHTRPTPQSSVQPRWRRVAREGEFNSAVKRLEAAAAVEHGSAAAVHDHAGHCAGRRVDDDREAAEERATRGEGGVAGSATVTVDDPRSLVAGDAGQLLLHDEDRDTAKRVLDSAEAIPDERSQLLGEPRAGRGVGEALRQRPRRPG